MKKSARERSVDDWQMHKSRHLVFGTLVSDGPLLNPEVSPFYITSLRCDATNDDVPAFMDEYNKTTEELIASHGIPTWAPAERRPCRQTVLELLDRDGKPMSSFQFENSPYESRIAKEFAKSSLMWCRERDVGL